MFVNPFIGKDLFGFWLACVSCAVVAAVGATAGWHILRPAAPDGDPRVIPVALAALPDPEPAEEEKDRIYRMWSKKAVQKIG